MLTIYEYTFLEGYNFIDEHKTVFKTRVRMGRNWWLVGQTFYEEGFVLKKLAKHVDSKTHREGKIRML